MNIIPMFLHSAYLLTNFNQLYCTYVNMLSSFSVLCVVKFSFPRLTFDQPISVFYLQPHGDFTTKQLKDEHMPRYYFS